MVKKKKSYKLTAEQNKELDKKLKQGGKIAFSDLMKGIMGVKVDPEKDKS